MSADNGDMPLWVSSSELAYIGSDRTLTVARLQFDDGVQVVERTSLFPVDSYNLDDNAWPYDVFPGGDEFLFVRSPTRENTTVIVLGWLDSLERRFEERGR